MGLLDSLEGMAAQAMSNSGNNTTKVAGGLMEALQNHPGGLSAVLDTMRSNGVGGAADAAQSGQTPQMSASQVAQGLQGTGLIDIVAAKAGVSPQVAQEILSTVLPMVLAHFGQNGSAPDSGALLGMLSKLL